MAIRYAGFLSYVRFDDAHENGRLSEFCKRLSGEVRVQTGEPFPIFQDREDISWGQQWKERIETSIDSVTFLIPIITPGFFKSGPCREELERFLDREKELGRNDLILPVHYVNCLLLNDDAKRRSDSLAAVIAARQLADWRNLRFEPFTSPDVGKTIARMAAQIVEAVEREPAPLPKRKQKLAQEAQTGAEQRTREMPRRAVQAKQPPTRIVDPLHRGDHASVAEAVRLAKPGDRILVRPGLYTEGVVIDKPVEIIGDGPVEEVVIQATNACVVLFKTSMGRIANLTLRQAAGGEFFAVDIGQGRLEIEGCVVSSQSLSCVGIHGGADPRLRRNRIQDGRECGILIYDGGRGTLEDNEIFSNQLAGIETKTGGDPIVRRNQIHSGRACGIFVNENGRGTFEENEIASSAEMGIEVSEGGDPVVRRNRVHDGKLGGVWVHDKGAGIFEENDIFANADTNVEVSREGNPVLRRNRIHNGEPSGVFVGENGLGTFEDNEIYENATVGIEVASGGNPLIRRNRVSKHAHEAIWIRDGGKGTYEDNDLRGNAKGAWDIAPECEAGVKRSNNQE